MSMYRIFFAVLKKAELQGTAFVLRFKWFLSDKEGFCMCYDVQQ